MLSCRLFCGRCAALSLAVGLLFGCNKSVESGASAFQSASPEIRKAWDSATAALKTNGYATAIIQLQQLRAQSGITIEQGKAIEQATAKINQQMYDAANRNDPGAIASIEELRKAMGR